MTFLWATRIPKTSAPSLVSLMPFIGVRVAEVDDQIWITGEATSEAEKLRINACLKQIAGAVRFDRLADDQLIESGNTLPSTRLPSLGEMDWDLLTDWITFRFPSASLVGAITDKAAIEFVRRSSPLANESLEPSILLCRIEALVAWADLASKHRIRRLSFACNPTGTVIVRGTPLPLIRGVTFVEHDQIAIESGHSWSPAVSIETLKEILKVDDSQLLLCQAGKPIQTIQQHDFVAATRAGIRLTGNQFGSTREAL